MQDILVVNVFVVLIVQLFVYMGIDCHLKFIQQAFKILGEVRIWQSLVGLQPSVWSGG